MLGLKHTYIFILVIMPLRTLKDGKEIIYGVNGKKLQYFCDEKKNLITCKNTKNWTEEAQDIVEIMYDDYNFNWEEKKRGRPGKTKKQEPKRKNKTLTRKDKKTPKKTAATYDTSEDEETNDDSRDENKTRSIKKKDKLTSKFIVGKRVKVVDKLEMGIGKIIKVFKNQVIVSFDKKLIKTTLDKLQGVRGRAPKKKQLECSDSEEEKSDFCNENLDDIDWIKIDGDLYLINKKNEVSNLNGDYIGIYRNNELLKI